MSTKEDVFATTTAISSGTYRQCMVAVSPNKGRNIAVMAVSGEGERKCEDDPKVEMSVAVSLDTIELLDDEEESPGTMSPPDQFRSITPTMWENHSPPPIRIGSPRPNIQQQTHTVRQSPFAAKRNHMSSPPPKQTPPVPDDDFLTSYRSTTPLPFSRTPSPNHYSCASTPSSDSPIPRSTTPLPFSSPPARRVSSPLYIIGSPTPDKRPVSPVPAKVTSDRARPVMMRMATVCVTSPGVARRSITPTPALAYSTDDTKCDYSSLFGPARKEDLVETDIRDTVRLQKMFRQLQRQIHSPEHQVYIVLNTRYTQS